MVGQVVEVEAAGRALKGSVQKGSSTTLQCCSCRSDGKRPTHERDHDHDCKQAGVPDLAVFLPPVPGKVEIHLTTPRNFVHGD